jgi:hypothetical protein
MPARIGRAGEKPEALSEQAAHHGEVWHETRRRPGDEASRIRKLREPHRDKQKRRRVMPGKIAGIIPAQHIDLNLLVNRPVPGERALAFEGEFTCGPDVDVVGADEASLSVEQPGMAEIHRGNQGGVEGREQQAGLFERHRNAAQRRRW